ncbi:hypothetical protein Ciccas_001721 [Cichlidogyrus casuarinus]|uniref:Uncharacterized protein n=1 Tax=Cichlidogyrus casuarinus TaxID=1844966 RepID=A0ABD2QJT7_9PLAT
MNGRDASVEKNHVQLPKLPPPSCEKPKTRERGFQVASEHQQQHQSSEAINGQIIQIPVYSDGEIASETETNCSTRRLIVRKNKHSNNCRRKLANLSGRCSPAVELDSITNYEIHSEQCSTRSCSPTSTIMTSLDQNSVYGLIIHAPMQQQNGQK